MGESPGAVHTEPLRELQERSRPEFIAPSAFGIIYTGLGDHARAFTWLNKAVDEHDTRLVDMLVDPRLDRLRSDPRYTALLARMEL